MLVKSISRKHQAKVRLIMKQETELKHKNKRRKSYAEKVPGGN